MAILSTVRSDVQAVHISVRLGSAARDPVAQTPRKYTSMTEERVCAWTSWVAKWKHSSYLWSVRVCEVAGQWCCEAEVQGRSMWRYISGGPDRDFIVMSSIPGCTMIIKASHLTAGNLFGAFPGPIWLRELVIKFRETLCKNSWEYCKIHPKASSGTLDYFWRVSRSSWRGSDTKITEIFLVWE